jgi:hypothetical protein
MQGQQTPPVVAGDAESGTWSKFEPANAGFTILLPGHPRESSAPLPDRPGVEHHLMTLETKLAGYVVSYVEFPDEITDPEAIKEVLDRGREGGIASSKATLTSEKEVKLKQFFGREWTMKLPNGLVSTVHAYWVKRRLYQTIFVAAPTADDSAQLIKLRQDVATRFLDSFTLSGDNVAK